jgi:hypothetical protein
MNLKETDAATTTTTTYYLHSVNVERREASVWKRPKSALLSAVGAILFYLFY